MASLLDASLLGFFAPLFIFLFLFAVMYALLQRTNIFGTWEGVKALNLIAAFSVAAVATFIGDTTVKLISSVLPWIVFVIVIFVLLFGLYMFFGLSEKKVWDIVGQTPVFVIVLIIILIGLSAVFEKELSPYQTSDGESRTVINDQGEEVLAENKNPRSAALDTLTHPRLLGALFMLIVAGASIKLIVDKIEVEKEK